MKMSELVPHGVHSLIVTVQNTRSVEMEVSFAGSGWFRNASQYIYMFGVHITQFVS